MSLIRVVGWDPSLRHWGIAAGYYDLTAQRLKIQSLTLSEPVLPTGKQTRQNSKDLESAVQHTNACVEASQGAQAIFVEVPVGSQSARAMAGYALCVGVLGALRAGGIQFIEVTPTEVKLAATGIKNATKKQMIEWATTTHPEAPWPYYKHGGKVLINESRAEHMADAIASIYAGIRTNQYQQILAMSRVA